MPCADNRYHHSRAFHNQILVEIPMINPPESLAQDGRPLPPQQCSCGYEFDCASDVEDASQRPGPGDFTLCFKCGEIYVFDESMKIQQPTIQKIRDMPADTWFVLEKAQRIIREQRFLDKKP